MPVGVRTMARWELSERQRIHGVLNPLAQLCVLDFVRIKVDGPFREIKKRNKNQHPRMDLSITACRLDGIHSS
jgi:hypothetical protein